MSPFIQQIVANNDTADVVQYGHLLGLSDTAVICIAAVAIVVLVLMFAVWAWRLFVRKTCFGCKDIKALNDRVEKLEQDVFVLLEAGR